MHSDNPLAIHLQELELSLLQATARKSALVSQLLADEFVEFGSSGTVFSKAQVIASLQAESEVDYSATAFTFKLLAPQTALLTYRACRHSEPPIYSLRSSVWQQRDGRWQMVFHQGTVTSEKD